jgi:hypothetical protein
MICTSGKGRFTDDEESRTATRREMVLGTRFFFFLHQTFGWCSPEECEKLAGKP